MAAGAGSWLVALFFTHRKEGKGKWGGKREEGTEREKQETGPDNKPSKPTPVTYFL